MSRVTTGTYGSWSPPGFMAWLGVFLLVGAQLGCVQQIPGDSDASLALEDIAAGHGPSRLKEQTQRPNRQGVVYGVEGDSHRGDLYLSLKGTRAGIVLVPGVVPGGKDDSRIVALARTLARLQFAVLVPDLPGPRHFRVRASDVGEVAVAFRYLVSRRDLVPDGRVGVAGFSYGAGPVLLAALEPDIREDVRFVITLGGYYDLHNVVAYFTTGYYRAASGGGWQRLEPHPYAKWVFALSNADLVERAADRSTLRVFARESLDDPDWVHAIQPTRLAPDARALYNLLTNQDPERVEVLIEQLPKSILDELEGLNPATKDLSDLQAEVILVHGRSDNMIPYTESVALARDLPSGQARLFLMEGLAHVDVRITRKDIPPLLDAMEVLLSHRASN